jgi:hypothetical protein
VSDTFVRRLRARFGAPLAGEGVALGCDALAADATPRIVKIARAPEARAALAREVEATLRLASPTLRRVLASARDDDETIAVLEHVEGTPLDAHLARRPDDAERIAIALLRVLRGMHEAGVVHGDVKPEHVLIEASGAVRLIDLGLVAPIGATARGGTHGFLAPELLRGAPVSPASDLFALGLTLRAAGGAALSRRARLAPLIEACAQVDPAHRPASAGTALSALGAGGVDAPTRAPAVRAPGLAEGGVVVVRAAPGAGRTSVARAFVDARVARGTEVVDLDGAPGHDGLAALATLLGIPASEEPARRGAMAAIRVEAPIVLDDADRLDEDARASLIEAARAIALARRGALLVVGADEALAQALVAEGAKRTTLAPLDRDGVRRVLSTSLAPADEATVAAVLEATEGCAGLVGRAACALAEHPEAAAREVVAEALGRASSARALPADDRADGGEGDEPTTLASALRALEGGAPRRAAAILRAIAPDAERDPPRHPEAARVLARAEASAGRLAAAVEILDALHASPGTGGRARRVRAAARERGSRPRGAGGAGLFGVRAGARRARDRRRDRRARARAGRAVGTRRSRAAGAALGGAERRRAARAGRGARPGARGGRGARRGGEPGSLGEGPRPRAYGSGARALGRSAPRPRGVRAGVGGRRAGRGRRGAAAVRDERRHRGARARRGGGRHGALRAGGRSRRAPRARRRARGGAGEPRGARGRRRRAARARGRARGGRAGQRADLRRAGPADRGRDRGAPRS